MRREKPKKEESPRVAMQNDRSQNESLMRTKRRPRGEERGRVVMRMRSQMRCGGGAHGTRRGTTTQVTALQREDNGGNRAEKCEAVREMRGERQSR